MATLGGLSAYVGFFWSDPHLCVCRCWHFFRTDSRCNLLWTTWLLTSMYDVRYVTDSIFERCCRGSHFAVLVGFVTVSPNFDPNDQDFRVFRTFFGFLTAQL
ncbi:hypothetical protein EV126DRAFT_40185 [Verticillium dahliae]|nr:hypothetical protein EV126DRAFT_40185 [Verticillium dahliae]